MGFDEGAVTILTESKKYLATVPKKISVQQNAASFFPCSIIKWNTS
jgi:hypothetical protein